MTDERVRELVRDELERIRLDEEAVMRATIDQFMASHREMNQEQPGDGPFVREIKRILRGAL